jgi:hypothetical protein
VRERTNERIAACRRDFSVSPRLASRLAVESSRGAVNPSPATSTPRTPDQGGTWSRSPKIRWRLADFYDAAIDATMPESTRLAETIQTWWPAILVALTEQVTNARTEGFNRIIKQTKRVGCGYRNLANYQRRILSHIAVTRPQT